MRALLAITALIAVVLAALSFADLPKPQGAIAFGGNLAYLPHVLNNYDPNAPTPTPRPTATPTPTPVPCATVSGIISSDVTWGGNCALYHVVANTMVTNTATLTILPGTTVIFDPGFYLRIDHAKFQALGAADKPITLTSSRPPTEPVSLSGYWYGVHCVDSNCSLDYADIEYGGGGWVDPPLKRAALAGNNIHVDHSTFKNNPLVLYVDSAYGAGDVSVRNSVVYGQLPWDASGGRFASLVNGSQTFDNLEFHDGTYTYINNSGANVTVSNSRFLGSFGGTVLGVTQGSYSVSNSYVSIGNKFGGQVLFLGVDGYGSPTTVTNSTFVLGAAASVSQVGTGQVELHNNNIIRTENGTDIRVTGTDSSATSVSATNNYWGTTDASAIAQRIYDYYDDFTLIKVEYQPFLTAPVQGAPAY